MRQKTFNPKLLIIPVMMAALGSIACLAQAGENAVYESDCFMQTSPKTPNEPPRIFNKAHVQLQSGQEFTIYKKGGLTYAADFIADTDDSVYTLMISLVDIRHGRKVIQATLSAHDLKALEAIDAGLYLPGQLPTAGCGPQM